MGSLPEWLGAISSADALLAVSVLVPLAYGVWVLILVRRGGHDSSVRDRIGSSLDRLNQMLPKRTSRSDS
jgi:hypothetical protein